MGQIVSSIFEDTHSTKYNAEPTYYYRSSTTSSPRNAYTLKQKLSLRKNDLSGEERNDLARLFNKLSIQEEEINYQKKLASVEVGSQRKIAIVQKNLPPLPRSNPSLLQNTSSIRRHNIVTQPTQPRFNINSESSIRRPNIVTQPRVNASSITTLYKPIDKPSQLRSKEEEFYNIFHCLASTLNYKVEYENYEVYALWQCSKHDSPSVKEFRLTSFQKFLTLTPVDLYNLFKRSTCECEMKVLITSFCVYKGPKYLNSFPAVEIVLNMIWNDHYRVLGDFKCKSCRKGWKSAYTWVKLQKFIEETPSRRLRKDHDYYTQKCNSCKGDRSANTVISDYEPLKRSEIRKRHKRELCSKCQSGTICRQTGNYFGKQSLYY